MKLHHIGIATDNIISAKQFIKKTHKVTKETGPIWDPKLKANLVFLNVKESTSIELVSGPIVDSLIKKNTYLYHFCYEVDDINNTLKKFRLNGANLIRKPTPAILFNNRLVSFLSTPLGIIELLQVDSKI